MPAFVGEMIGVIIVLGLIFLIFASLSGPVLDYLANYEAIKSFNRMTSSVSLSCAEGADTISYVNFPGAPFVIAVLNEDFTDEIYELELCDGKTEPCTTRISRSALSKCRNPEDYCLCVLKFELKRHSNKGCFFNNNTDMIVVGKTPPDISNPSDYYALINNGIQKIIDELDFENTENISKVEVLMCKTFDEMGCVYEEEEFSFPTFISPYGRDNIIIWMYTRGPDEEKRVHESLYFESLSFQRSIYRGEFYYYLNLYSNPTKVIRRTTFFDNSNEDLIYCKNI